MNESSERMNDTVQLLVLSVIKSIEHHADRFKDTTVLLDLLMRFVREADSILRTGTREEAFKTIAEFLWREKTSLTPPEMLSFLITVLHPSLLVDGEMASLQDVLDLFHTLLEKDPHQVESVRFIHRVYMTYDGPLCTIEDWKNYVNIEGADFSLEPSLLFQIMTSETIDETNKRRANCSVLTEYRRLYQTF